MGLEQTCDRSNTHRRSYSGTGAEDEKANLSQVLWSHKPRILLLCEPRPRADYLTVRNVPALNSNFFVFAKSQEWGGGGGGGWDFFVTVKEVIVDVILYDN